MILPESLEDHRHATGVDATWRGAYMVQGCIHRCAHMVQRVIFIDVQYIHGTKGRSHPPLTSKATSTIRFGPHSL